MENRPPGPDADTHSKDNDNESEDRRSREAPVRRRIPMQSLREIMSGAPEQVASNVPANKSEKLTSFFSVIEKAPETPFVPDDQAARPTTAEAPAVATASFEDIARRSSTGMESSLDEDDEEDEEGSAKTQPKQPQPTQVAEQGDPANGEEYADTEGVEEPEVDTPDQSMGAEQPETVVLTTDSVAESTQDYAGLATELDPDAGLVKHADTGQANVSTWRSTTPMRPISQPNAPAMNPAAAFAPTEAYDFASEAIDDADTMMSPPSDGEALPPLPPPDALSPIDGSTPFAMSAAEADASASPVAAVKSAESAVPRHGHGIDTLLAVGLVAEHFVAKNRTEKARHELLKQIADIREQAEQEQVAIRKLQTNAGGQTEQLGTMQAETAQHILDAQKTQEQMHKDLQIMERKVTINNDAHADVFPAVQIAPETDDTPRQSLRAEIAAPLQVGSEFRQALRRTEFTQQTLDIRNSLRQEMPTERMHSQEPVAEVEVTADRVRLDVEADQKEQEIVQRTATEQLKVTTERDAPAERSYERRSEVRDDPGSSGGGGDAGALSTPSVVDKGASDQLSVVSGHVDTHGTERHPLVDDTDAPYKSAVLGGFAGAVVVLVLALIVYFLLR